MSHVTRVCIIGGGPQGLVALKNLLELNVNETTIFEAELLESRDCVGGKWAFAKDADEITALPNTIQNTSRFHNCYSDFPVAEAWRAGGREGPIPAYLNQEETEFYIDQYVRRFGLLKHIRFRLKVNKLERDEDKGQWKVDALHMQSGKTTSTLYDKVVVATGQHHDPNIPHVDGIERFTGKVIHSQEFKSNKDFAGLKVIVIGSSNTAGDVSTEVAAVAKTVLLSHRRGITIAPRWYQSRPLDLTLNRRINVVRWGITALAPAYMTFKSEPMLKKMVADAWKGRLKPEWGLSPETAPSVSFTPPMVSDTFVPLLEAGAVTLVPAIRRITEDGKVELQDERVVEADAIIYCTGYHIDPVLASPIERSGDLKLPRLYQKIYHPDHPTSLAYLTYWHTVAGICELGDLAAMGIAQVFSGRFKLPPRADIEKQIETMHGFVNGLAARVPRPISLSAAAQCLDQGPWVSFLHEAAGTQVPELLGYGLQGWRFWFSDRQFCNLLMSGVDSIHTARLFDGRKGSRTRWEGAREAILEANKEIDVIVQKRKDEEQAQKDKSV